MTQPVLNFDPELLLRAQPVRVAFFDVDGVLTDGGLLFSESGETLKRFHTLDGHGIKLLQKAGITPAVITGRDSAPLRVRLKALGVEHAVFGTEDKRPAAEQVLATLGLNWSQAAAMGDDWPDLPVMRAIGVPEIAAWLKGDIDRDTMMARGQLATRQYAKRQYTWFSNQPPQDWHREKRSIDAEIANELAIKLQQ